MKLKRTMIFIFILVIFSILFGYNYFKKPFLSRSQDSDEEIIELKEISDQDESSNTSWWHDLSSKEKIFQLLALPIEIENDIKVASDAVTLDWLAENKPGFITIFGEEISTQSAKLSIDNFNHSFGENRLKPIIAVDHEGGVVQRLSGSGFTILPSWRELCLSKEELGESFEKSAQELKDVGINVVFAPVADLSAAHPVLRSRVCGDKESLLKRTNEFILAFASRGIMPVAKHFPGIGKTSGDLHKKFESISLEVDDLEVFQTIFNQYPNIGLMVTHVGVTGKFDNMPCSLSSECLEYFIEKYPEALVFSDALEMDSAREGFLASPMGKVIIENSLDKNPEEASGSANQQNILAELAKQALLAGNDVLVFGNGVTQEDLEEISEVLSLEYKASDDFKNKVDQSLEKIIRIKSLE